MIIEKHEIQIDQITSGKVNIFTFYRNRKQIDDQFYDCKNHRLQQTTSSIFILMQRACIYCRKSFRAYIRTTVVKRFTTGRKKMKAELQHQIQTGKWNKRVRIGNRILDVVFTWCDEDIVE